MIEVFLQVSSIALDHLLPPALLSTCQEMNTPLLCLAVSSFITSLITTILEEETLLFIVPVTTIASQPCLSLWMLIRNIFLEKEEHQDDGCSDASVMVDCRVSTINTHGEDNPVGLNGKRGKSSTIWRTLYKLFFVISLGTEMILTLNFCMSMFHLLMLVLVLAIMLVLLLMNSPSIVKSLCTQTLLIFLTIDQIIVLIIPNLIVLMSIIVWLSLSMVIYAISAIAGWSLLKGMILCINSHTVLLLC